jgi:predicted PurR-regulated permease PerM
MEPTPVRLDTQSTRRIVLWALALWIGVQVLIWVFGATGHFLFVLLLSWLLAIAIEPPVAALAKRGWRRGSAAGVVLIAVILAVIAFFSVFGGLFFSQLAAAVQALPGVVDALVTWANNTFDAQLNAQTVTDELALTPERVASIAGSVAGGVVGIVTSVVGFLFELLTILIFAFYLSAESPAVRRTLASWLRPNRQHVFITVWDIAVAKTGGFVVSRIVLALMSSLAHIIAFWAIGIEYWMPLGLFAGIVSQFIPTIGTYIGIIVPVAFAAPQAPLDAVWIIAFATIYQQIENYVLGPRISKATMDLHPAVTLASVFIGAALFGPIGAIIGIPIAAAVIAVMDTYGKRYQLVPELEEHLQNGDGAN